ncbi:MAG: hypothetical protein QG635_2137, partial [Bacteroidota bacterium]|nr:hypothetical protein [Bacteroidota bacterium]
MNNSVISANDGMTKVKKMNFMKIILLSIILLSLTIFCARSQNDTIYSDWNGHCYMAVLTNITWAQADIAAQAMGGHLAIISSDVENVIISDLVSNDPRFWAPDAYGYKQGPWIGGYQKTGSTEPAGGWTWVDNNNISYNMWAPGEPNNRDVNEDRLCLYYLSLGNGCYWNDYPGTAALRGYIVEFDSMVLPNAGQDRSICYGDTTVLGGSPSAMGGVQPYSYEWFPKTLLSSPNIPNPMASPSATTEYYLRVIPKYGCERWDTVVVNVKPETKVEAGRDTTGCFGDIIINGGAPAASGGEPPYSFRWFPNAFLSDPTVSNPTVVVQSRLVYKLQVTDGNGCLRYDSVTVQTHPVTIVDAGGDKPICFGEWVMLGGKPTASHGDEPFTYEWSPKFGLDNYYVSNPMAHPDSSTIYSLIVTDGHGCVFYDTLKVWVNPGLKIKVKQWQDLCYGSGIPIGDTASGGRPPYIYSWEPKTGLSEPLKPKPIANPKSSQMYNITVTDKNGCVVRDSVFVNVLPELSVKIQSDKKTVCPGENLQLNANGSGGSGPTIEYKYNWQPSFGISDIVAQNPLLTLVQPGIYQYQVSLTDSAGCIVYDTISVKVIDSRIASPDSSIDFGLLDACTSTREKQFLLRNPGKDPVTIDSFSVGRDFEVLSPALPYLLDTSAKVTVRIRYVPKTSGISTGKFTVYASPCNAKCELALKGEKEKLLLTASTTNINFGKFPTCSDISID